LSFQFDKSRQANGANPQLFEQKGARDISPSARAAAEIDIVINDNTQALIQNPLRQFSPEELAEAVDIFAEQHHLEDIKDVLQKGAQIARDPYAPQSQRELTKEELDALRAENQHPLRQPSKFWLTIVLCCFAAILQGWSQVGVNPANTSWPHEFGVVALVDEPFDERAQWIVGAVNAAPYFAAAIVGCWLSVWLSEYYGRRFALLFASSK